jgi:hypothetical protein
LAWNGAIFASGFADFGRNKDSQDPVLVAQESYLGCHNHDRNNSRVLRIPDLFFEMKLGIYEHYKGKQYEVLALAKHSETLEDMVVYKPLYKNEYKGYLWVRLKKEFTGKININGKKVKRFKFIAEAK